MKPPLRITLVSTDQALAGHLAIRLQSKGYQVLCLSRLAGVLGSIYSDPPNIVIADLAELEPEILAIVKAMKADCYFSTIPVLGLLSGARVEEFDWEGCPLDDFVAMPVLYPELFSRISLSLQRIQRVFDNNPLTRLPGNTSIQHAIEKALGKPMAVCYVDINNFKPYNDVYGFSHGDGVLRMLARIIFNGVNESGGGFAGHIGGDDFVYLVPLERAEAVAKTVIANFTTIVADLFGEEEKTKGFYCALNRKGQEEQVPLLGIAIAIVPTHTAKMQHYGKVAEVAAEMKKLAKQSNESCYVIDRRST
jgi:diguanylate cyclase (GGDEF)-like protein